MGSLSKPLIIAVVVTILILLQAGCKHSPKVDQSGSVPAVELAVTKDDKKDTSAFFVQTTKLPSLDSVKFVKGRCATKDDLESQTAGFVIEDKGITKYSSPCNIQIPQYAVHTDEQGKQTPGIIVQAETVKQTGDVFALRTADGTFLLGLRKEFKLLGTKRPD